MEIDRETDDQQTNADGELTELDVPVAIPGWEAPLIRPSVVSAALSRGALLSDDRLEISVDTLTQQPVLRVTRGAVDTI